MKQPLFQAVVYEFIDNYLYSKPEITITPNTDALPVDGADYGKRSDDG